MSLELLKEMIIRFREKLRDENEETLIRYNAVLSHFNTYLKKVHNKNLLQANGEDIISWREDLEKTGGKLGYDEKYTGQLYPNSLSTIETKTCALSTFYNFLGRPNLKTNKRLIEANPVDALDNRHHIVKYGRSKKMSFSNFLSILKQVDTSTVVGKRDLAILKGYFLTGRRRREVINLKWGDLNFTSSPPSYKYIGKGRKNFTDELPDDFVKSLFDYLKSRYGESLNNLNKDAYLFTSLSTNSKDINKPLTGGFVWKLIKDLAEKAKKNGANIDVDQITIHGIRHLCAQEVLEQSGDVIEVQRRLNHQSLATTQVYLNTIKSQLNKHASKMADKLNGV